MAEPTAAPSDSRKGRLSRWLSRPLDLVAGAILLCLMVLTCADVLGRYLFNAPVNGATELTSLLMAGMIFAALPVVSAREDHVTVDLLDAVFPTGLINLRQTILNAVAAIAMSVVCWRVWILAGRHAQYGDTTEFLQLPIAPVVYFIGVMCGLAALLLLINVVSYLRGEGRLSP